MTTPPPPWEAHPPLSEDDGFFGAEARHQAEHDGDSEEDTGPIRVASDPVESVSAERHEPARPHHRAWSEAPLPPALEQNTFADRFTAPLTVDPRRTPVQRTGGVRPGIVVAAAVAGLVLVVLAAWFLWPWGGSDDGAAATAGSTPTVDAAAVEKLKDALPAGYSSDACKAVEAPDGAAAKVDCAKNSDVDGPPSATYTAMNDAAALKTAMDDVVADASIVNCPGNIQSPGPWRRNASPTKIAGNLVCGLPQGRPMIAWTNDANLVLSMTKAGPEGPTLDQLYRWWSNHS